MRKIVPLFCLLLAVAACTRGREPSSPSALSLIHLFADTPPTRALDPDENCITDYNLLIFNVFGILEEKVFVSNRQLKLENGKVCHRTRLLQDVPYTVLAAANLGYELPCRTLEEALSYRYHMAYPDEFTPGMPMAAILEGTVTGKEGILEVPLQRLMAKIELTLDRRSLDKDVRFTVREVRVGGCPSSVRLFGRSKAESATDIFREGYLKDWRQVSALNREVSVGVSEPLSVYLLENAQGDLLEHVTTPQGKVFTDSRYQEVCSYIEIKAEYHSPSASTRPGEHLVYRFYLGEDLNNFDVFRNVHYRVTVRPEGDGLKENSWRVDQGGMEVATRFELKPAAYNECASGDSFRIWCEVEPPGTPMYIEPLAYDDDPRVRELYHYTLDPDGNGLTIHTWKGGSAVIYFKAGPPVNRDTLAMLVIDP